MPAKYSLREDGILDPEGKFLNPFTKMPYSSEYKKEAIKMKDGVNKGWSGYRTWEDRFEILQKIHNYQIVLIVAPTGVGKTVIVPKLFLHYFGYKTPVICTTPRQKTTRKAGDYAAQLMDVHLTLKHEKTGKEIWSREKDFYVGYKYGDMQTPKSDKSTKLLFSTDGTIKVMITKSNPNLDGYAGIIIDEAHERSVSIDILLGLVIDICKRRPEFKVIIMSATVNAKTFLNYFDVLGLGDKFTVYEPKEVPGNYNIEHIYQPESVSATQGLKKLQTEIDTLLKDNSKMDLILGPGNIDQQGKRFMKYGRDILAFIASGSEGLQVKRYLDAMANKKSYKYRPYVMVFTKDTEGLDMNIALDENGLEKANSESSAKGAPYQIKVILSTPVAESSITFSDPLAYVFDTGRDFTVQFNPILYGFASYKRYVARANITQRCGRTGRTNNGYCIHTYSKDQYQNDFKGFPDPEIMTQDITDDLLGICLLPSIQTIDRCLAFLGKLIEPLENYRDNIKVGFRNLLYYDCIDKNGRITPFARICAAFGKYNYHIVRMICMGYYTGVLIETIYLAGILSNIKAFSDLFYKPVGMEDDPVLMRKLMGNMKFFAHPLGEHLSLLNLYLEWCRVPPNKLREWETRNQIHPNRMKKIKASIDAITKIVIQNYDDIKALNLIKIYPGKQEQKQPQRAGGSEYLSDISTLDLTNKSLINIPSRDLFASAGIQAKPGCSAAYGSMVGIKQQLHRCRGASYYAQGGGQESQPKSASLTSSEQATQSKSNSHDKLRDFIEGDEFSMQEMFQNTKATGPVDLGPIQTWSIDERIMIGVYFGFFTQLAVFEGGQSNKYVVKYSPVIASIEESVLHDVLHIRPNFIVYHEYNINEERGNRIEVASHLPHKIIDVFMTAREKLTKKLKN